MGKSIVRAFLATTAIAAFMGLGAVANAAPDWRLALPTEAGIAFVDPSTAGPQAIMNSGAEFGQVDEILVLNEGARLLTGISSISSGNEMMMAYDVRTFQPVGATSFGSAQYGIIPGQTVPMPGGQIAIATFDGVVHTLDAVSGKESSKVQIEGTPFGLAPTANGAGLLVATKYEGEKGDELSLSSLKIGPLAIDKTVLLGMEKVDPDADEIKYSLRIIPGSAAVFSPTAAYIADLATMKVRKISPVYNKKALSPIGITGDGKKLICKLGDGSTGIFVYDIAAKNVAKRILMNGPEYAVASGDGSLFYVASPAKATLGLFDENTLDVVGSYPIEGLLGSVVILNEPGQSDLPVPKSIGGNIVVLCDSFLGGAGDAKDTFPSLLGKKLSADGYGIPVVNSTSSDGLAPDFADGFDDSVGCYNPKVLVVEMGLADLAEAAASVDEEAGEAAIAQAEADAVKAVAAGLDATLQKAAQAGLKTVLVWPANDKLKAVYDEAAKKFNIPVVVGVKGFKGSVDAAYPVISEIVASMAK